MKRSNKITKLKIKFKKIEMKKDTSFKVWKNYNSKHLNFTYLKPKIL